MKKNYKTIGVITLLVLVGGFAIYSYFIKGGDKELKKNDTESIFVENEEKTEEVVKSEKKIVVEIKGEVNKPNVYWLSEDSIVEDLIKEAGGLTNGADLTKLNRADKLKDHECIVVPNKNQVNETNISGSKTDLSRSNLININTANETELDTLPGIGLTRAKDIIRYREEKGGFKSIEDLKNVKGIGESSFEKLKDKITT
ncbi:MULTISPECIES: helix-hairpin-helix domain-containing protein [Clostridium]|uniref:Helix-hairpin-helix domain-containing protein n=1 Tax=Clostridium cibarium TaxID=2762247 RepID=A0ABR8PR19_9CLOT|nr:MULTISPECIES: helix-hairpin-helix domain-containing protein [Clostridium]MBD7910616.1 helix-hairpin-helix domain-containing protein [Clostridium cibarium]